MAYLGLLNLSLAHVTSNDVDPILNILKELFFPYIPTRGVNKSYLFEEVVVADFGGLPFFVVH